MIKKDYSKEILKIIREHGKNEWQFGKPEELISHDFPQKLTYNDIKKELSSLTSPVFTNKEKRENEYRYTIYTKDSRFRGKVFVITLRNENIRVITAFPIGRRTYLKYDKKKFKKKESLGKV
jgi:uncharacterized DUF497 family protein